MHYVVSFAPIAVLFFSFFYFKSNLNFLLFGSIFFCLFIFNGYGILDEICLFLFLLRFIYKELIKEEKTIFWLRKCLLEYKEDLKKDKIILIFSLIFLFYIFSTIVGMFLYDLKILRYTLFFSLIFIYFIFTKRYKFYELSYQNCKFITKVSIFGLFIYLLQGIINETYYHEDFIGRFETQGILVAGSSSAFMMMFLTTLPALKIYNSNKYLSLTYIFLCFLNITYYESRLGFIVIVTLLIINFYKKLHIVILLYIFSFLINLFIDFGTYYGIKHKRLFDYHLQNCFEERPSGFMEREIDIPSCFWIFNNDPIKFGIEKLDGKLWRVRENVTKLRSTYFDFKTNFDRKYFVEDLKETFPRITDAFINASINKYGYINYSVIIDEAKRERFFFQSDINKQKLRKLIEDRKQPSFKNLIFDTDLYSKVLISSDMISTGINYIAKDLSRGTTSNNIFAQPALSDVDRQMYVVGSLKLLNESKLVNKIFGYGFYSHKEKLVEPMNNLIKSNPLYKEYSEGFYNKEPIQYPVRTANLPLIITDGGILLSILYLLLYSIIGIHILII